MLGVDHAAREVSAMKNRIVILLLVIGPFLAVGSLFAFMGFGFYRASQVPSLHTAAEEGGLQEVQRLLGAGEPVNMQISRGWFDGQTPLMWAARHGHVEMVRFLLDSGADPSISDANGQTAWDYAELGESDLVLKMLEEHR
jgi:hypothetical protein